METTNESQEDLIASHPFLKGLDPSYLGILSKAAICANYEPAQTIFDEGTGANHFYLIHKGTVALEAHLPGMGSGTIQILGAGDPMGWSLLFPPFSSQLTARALERTEVTMFDARVLRDLVEQDHQFGYELTTRILLEVSQRLQAALELLVEGNSN
jgi:CRP-like cAMP-binding protein